MRAALYALVPEENRARFSSVRPHGSLLQGNIQVWKITEKFSWI